MKNLKNKCKRALAAVLSLVMCLGMLTVPAFAAEEVQHLEGCGYVCAHQHDEDCGAITFVDSTDPADGYVAAVEGQDAIPCPNGEDCTGNEKGHVAPVEAVEAKAEIMGKKQIISEDACTHNCETDDSCVWVCAEDCPVKAAEDAAKREAAEAALADMIAALPAPEDIDPADEKQVGMVYRQIAEIYAFAEENGLASYDADTDVHSLNDPELDAEVNNVIAALYPVETLEDPGADLPESPDMTGAEITVTPANAQYTLDGAYGSINGKTIVFTGEYTDILYINRPSKYSDSGTVYYNEYPGRTPVNSVSDLRTSGVTSYTRDLKNVTLTAAQGVVIPGIKIFNCGHHYGSGTDPVREVALVGSATSYYFNYDLEGLTFKDLTIQDQVEFPMWGDTAQKGSCNGRNITFTGCTFLGDAEKMTQNTSQAIRMGAATASYYNLKIEDCTFTNYYLGVYSYNVNGGSFTGNTFENMTNSAISLANDWQDRGLIGGDIEISGNTFKNSERGISFGKLDKDAKVSLTGNDIDKGHWCRALSENASQITLSGNKLNGVEAPMAESDSTDYMTYGPAVAQVGEEYYLTLQAAIDAVAKADETVTLLENVTEDVTITNKNITLDLNGKTVTGTGTGTVLTVNGNNVTLTGGGTITGGKTPGQKNGSGVYVGAGAIFTLSDGTISGSTAGSAGSAGNRSYGGGVYVDGNGKFVMTGGTISGNKSWMGGGVYVAKNGTFTMSGGTIAKNEVFTTGDSGTGVTVYGEFTMSGGTISDHKTAGSGGGVLVMKGGQFTMSGTALITRNQGENGGGVCIEYAPSKFTMNGGTISDNTTQDIDTWEGKGDVTTWNAVSGGGVLVYQGTFVMNAGEITGNKAVGQEGADPKKQGGSDGGGVAVWSSGTFTYNGGVICNNTAETFGDDMSFAKGTKLTLCATGDWTLAGGNRKITGWYEDAKNLRWKDNDTRTPYEITGEQITVEGSDLAFKAAYGVIHDTTKTEAKAATCTEAGNNEYWTCSKCGKVFKDEQGETETTVAAETIPAIGEHLWGEAVVTTPATETTEGVRTYTCARCGMTRTETIPILTHTHVYTETVTEPTCMEPGYTTHTCACGDSYRDTYVDALGHDFAEAWDHDAANHWHVCSRCGKNSDHVSHTETSEITRRPTYTREGERTYTCTVCGATRTESIDRLTYEPSYPSGGGSSGGTTTRPSTNTPSTTIPDNPAPLDPGTTDIVDQNVPLASIVLPFADVKNNAWYRDAVAYVFSKNLMNGVNGDAFAPDLTTQRGMIVTILHRLEGAPAAAAAAFADVQAGQWYADAVGWGSANGVVEGYSASEFAPLRNITREQLAAILYRYAQLKGYDTSKRADLSGYTDAASVSAYALEAVRWAVAEGLITGKTETTLVPGGEATRAEAAMILMRFCETIASAPAANETQGLPDGI